MKTLNICESIAYSTCLDAVFKMSILNHVLNMPYCTIYETYMHKIVYEPFYFGDYQCTLRRELAEYFKNNKIKKFDQFIYHDNYDKRIDKKVSFYLRLASALLKACKKDKVICKLVFNFETIKIKDRNAR